MSNTDVLTPTPQTQPRTSNKFAKLKVESNNFKREILFPKVLITPELAKDLLGLNTKNRAFKNHLIKRYTNLMIEGKWTFNGETISISWDGNLLNGQHRLFSIISSGKAQCYHIQTGLDPATFNTMDTGAGRSGADTIGMMGYAYPTKVSTLVRYLSVYELDLLHDLIVSQNIRFSNEELSKMVLNFDKTLLEESARISGRYSASRFMDPIPVMVLFYIFSQINADKALNFFDLLSTGDGVGAHNNSSIFLLRNKLINSMTSGNKMDNVHKWALMIKAWNLFKTNRQCKKLGWDKAKEEFPTIN